jgi:CDP-diacylglycerol--glycerol-3-phosphate 3-phosphatidyltransferase
VFTFGYFGIAVLSIAFYGFGVATDAIDGRIARATDTVTPFGCAMDSTADKTLVAAVMATLTMMASLPMWIMFAFVFREFIVFGLRVIRTSTGVTVAEIQDRLGRVRFLVLHVSLSIVLLSESSGLLRSIGIIGVVIATILAYVTLAIYVIRDWALLRVTMNRAK